MKSKQSSKHKQIKKSAKKATKSVAKKTNSNSDKTVKSIENGIKLLKYAIKNKMSVSEAAKENGYGRNYVSDIKSRIEKNYKSRSISREMYNSFKTSANTYSKVSHN